MQQEQFEAMVQRLEQESQASPSAYQFKVALLALAGFLIILTILGFAGISLLFLASIAIAILLTGGKAVILLFKLGKLLVILAVPCWMLIRASFSALFARFPKPQGIEIGRTEAPALFAEIDRMRATMKGPRIHHVLLINEINAAALQRPLLGLLGFPRNYLLLGLPLMESLSPDEMLAVVAHEYGHLAGSHSRFGAFIYRLRNTWNTILGVSSQWTGWVGTRLQKVVGWYAPYFNAYTFVLARANEYQADAASASLVGSAPARAALKRTNIVAQHYERFTSMVYDRVLDQAAPPADFMRSWATIGGNAIHEQKAAEWLQQSLARTPHFSDTHPALAQRLAALGNETSAADTLPPPIAGQSAAQAWLGVQADKLRARFQQSWEAEISERWRARHDEIQQDRARLAELRAIAEPTLEQKIETLNLQSRLEPEQDNITRLAEFNAAQPDIPNTLYLEASLRLDKEDESGLDILDRLMALDADAIKPACKRAWEYLIARNDARAAHYAERWQARNQWEAERAWQIDHPDPVTQALEPSGLDHATLDAIRALIEANRKGIAKIWFARRIIPADPDALVYMICIQPTAWTRLRNKAGDVVQRLAKLEWPVHLFLCTVDRGKYKAYKAQLKALPATLVFPHKE